MRFAPSIIYYHVMSRPHKNYQKHKTPSTTDWNPSKIVNEIELGQFKAWLFNFQSLFLHFLLLVPPTKMLPSPLSLGEDRIYVHRRGSTSCSRQHFMWMSFTKKDMYLKMLSAVEMIPPLLSIESVLPQCFRWIIGSRATKFDADMYLDGLTSTHNYTFSVSRSTGRFCLQNFTCISVISIDYLTQESNGKIK